MCYWHVPHICYEIEDFKNNAGPETNHVLLTYLCPTREGADVLNSKGIDALHIHHNAFIDERIYKITQGVEKRFAAVHNANTGVNKFKRHHLAWGVPQIAVITYAVDNIGSETDIAGYKDLAFVNKGANGNIEYLNGEGVNTIVNEARCGLILSEVEGGNFASTEYLLCGIPVVSTPSLGGRHEFFDPRHVKIVEPNAEAVERAVKEWGYNAPPPEEIRRSALVKSRMFRARLLHWLSAISGQDLFANADENLWSPLFIDKLRAKAPVPQDKIPDVNDPTVVLSHQPVISQSSTNRLYRSLGKFLKPFRVW